MIQLNRTTVQTDALPIKIVQFGEGNFLRAFVDSFVHKLNEKANYRSGIAVIQPIDKGMVDVLQSQGGLYHHIIQGVENGEQVNDAVLVSAVQLAVNPFKDPKKFYELAESTELKLVFSNTTEAGIAFDQKDHLNGSLASTFPGKMVQFLKRRFDALGNSHDSEIGIVPCELIESNGDKLKACIFQYIDLWNFSDDFKKWVEDRVHFANTLVDRIVPGYPADEIDAIKARIGFNDQLVVKSESFHLFVIEGDVFIQRHFPAHMHGFNVKYVNSITPYRTQKVRILNGAHTSMVPVGLLSGLETVKETLDDKVTGAYVRSSIFEEIVETINIPGEDPKEFANQVIGRFQNPFIRHELATISLNSIAKWKVRVLPTILDYQKEKGTLPTRLMFSLACLIELYSSKDFNIKDDQSIVEYFHDLRTENDPKILVEKVLSNDSFWGQDLTKIPTFLPLVVEHVSAIRSSSVTTVLTSL
jgi:tagaturonate reductase